jgi:phosphodiesterase/alkaline phosphatase D-like protein
MRNVLLMLALGVVLIAGCREPDVPRFQSRWRTSLDRDWVGSEYWANRLQDWRVRDARLECVGAYPMRTVHLLTRRVGKQHRDFRLSVRLGTMTSPDDDSGSSSAGFLIGAGQNLDYRAAALIHHSPGESAGIYIGVDTHGRLFWRDLEEEDGHRWLSEEERFPFDSVRLTLSLTPLPENAYSLDLSAVISPGNDTIEGGLTLVRELAARVPGALALVCDPRPNGTTSFWFRCWSVEGDKLEAHESRLAGPVIGSQYTLSRGTLKLTAQLMPIGTDDEREVELQVREGRSWKTIARAPIVVPGYTATFKVDGWDARRDVRYRVAYALNTRDGSSEPYFREGVIRREPVDKDEIVAAAFTGNHNVAHPGVDRGQFDWSTGLWFPHADVVRHVKTHDPDFLFFSGDQVYEGASPTRADFSQRYKDYLYKWYLWYWAFGELVADIPSVTIPDDHDVYHGNLWGAGGKATPPGLSGAAAQDAGGYKLPPEFVDMVHRTQTSHLPDPYDPTPVEQRIGVYYTDILYGGVSFAVIEDRKFKSAPAPLLPDARIWNGWPQNPEFDAMTRADVPGATLLGDRQLRFLEDWANDWRGGTWMKVVLSQTLFANLATLPDSATSGALIPSLPILAPGEYAANEKLASEMDSNGWPQSGRNEALRAMRKGFAVHLAGDQHLGSTTQYGIDEWGDAAYALCVPSIANFWPRRWFPPTPGANRDPEAPPYSGDYEDGFGNEMTVLAVSNPHRWGREPANLHDRSPGYGIARFNRRTRQISLEAWPRWADPSQGEDPYPGWPVTFAQADNYGREAVAHLPHLEVRGIRDPVVQIVDEASGAIVYTLRIAGDSFVPKVFWDGSYTIHVGEPGTENVRTLSGIRSAQQPDSTITVRF